MNFNGLDMSGLDSGRARTSLHGRYHGVIDNSTAGIQ